MIRGQLSYFKHLRIFSVDFSLAVLPTMLALLGLYVAFHTPLRDLIASMLSMKSRGCFFCDYTPSFNNFLDSFSALMLIIISLLAAWILAHHFEGKSYEQPLAFGFYAMAFVVVPAAAIGGVAAWMDMGLLQPPIGPLLVALPATAYVALAGTRDQLRWPEIRWLRPSSLVLWVGGFAALSLLASAAISLEHPLTGFDALGYHEPLAVFLWRDGNLTAFLQRAPGNWPLANPGTYELLLGLLQITGGEKLAGLGQFPFALLGATALYAFVRRSGLRSGAAMLSALAFLTAPMVIMQSGMPLNDVVGAALLIGTIAIACEPARDWTTHRLFLLGLGLGLVATTKLALLPGVAAIGACVIVGVSKNCGTGRAGIRAAAKRLVPVALAFALVVAPWWIRDAVRYWNPVYPADLPFLGRGVVDPIKADAAFVPSPVFWPLYPLLENYDEQSGMGALFALSVIPGMLFAFRRSRRQPLVLYLIAAAFMLPAWWIMTQHFPRFLLAIIGLGFGFLPWALLAIPRGQRRIGAVIIAVGVFVSIALTFVQALSPWAAQPNDRAEFYNRVWAVDPNVMALPESEGLLFYAGYANSVPEYAAYYPLLGASGRRLVVPMEAADSSEAVIERMRTNGLRYAYVAASPENYSVVETLFDASRFEQINVSSIVAGEHSGFRQYIYRYVDEQQGEIGTRRYLFRLK